MKQKILSYTLRHKRFLVILAGIVLLNMLYGMDMRFTIINLLWILISVVKI